jgi:hypothetical protein
MGDPHADPIRQELRTLVDHIPSSDLPTARKFVRSLVDPAELAILNAPPDDEPESEEERAEVEAALADPSPDTAHEELLREFGL